MPPPEKDRLDGIDSLRAVAALSVVWFHFTQGGNLLGDGWLKASGRLGWTGAHMFFVISGFVLPWALDRIGYEPISYPRFLARRIVRLQPPYLVSIAVVEALWLASSLAPGFRGEPYQFRGQDLALHLVYLNGWFDRLWVNPVYWSLAIEIQFYLLLGLAFPILASSRPLVRRVSFTALCLGSSLALSENLVLTYGALFAAGFASFLVMRGQIGRVEFGAHLLLVGASLWVHAPVQAVVAVATAIAILALSTPVPGLEALGRMSYSLYLLHCPIGGRLINLGSRLPPNLGVQLAVLIGAVAISLAAALLFYRWVELPAQSLARRIGYTGIAPARRPLAA